MICSEPVCSFFFCLRVCVNTETNSVAISGATYLHISRCNCNSCGQEVVAAALMGSLFSVLLPGL